jgi:zinc transport system ATP-binding protein
VNGVKVLEMQGVYFSYGSDVILEDITIAVEEGDFLILVGRNGSGKTTLVRLFLGLLHPVQGEILLFGDSIRKFRDWYRIGYVPQTPALAAGFPATVKEIVATGRFGRIGRCHRLHREDWQAVEEAIDLVGLSHLRDSLLTELSGGQRQRAFIARALAGRPDLLILDEPQSGLDDGTRRDFYRLLHRLNCEQGITILMVSHDTDMPVNWANRIALLDRCLLYQGPPPIPAQLDFNGLSGKAAGSYFISRLHLS